MKNKEIEELLNNFQEILDNPTTTDECYDGRIIEIDRSYDLEQDEIKLLLSYIEQLENNRDKAIEYIENDMPYLEEPDDDYENNHKMNEYNKNILLDILKGGSDE